MCGLWAKNVYTSTDQKHIQPYIRLSKMSKTAMYVVAVEDTSWLMIMAV